MSDDSIAISTPGEAETRAVMLGGLAVLGLVRRQHEA
jgi:hypothetical protein